MTTSDEVDLEGELGYTDEGGYTVPPPDDAEQANRMLRTLRYLRRQMDAIEELHTVEVAALGRWRNGALEPLRNRYNRIEQAVAAWGRAVNLADERTKTIGLPYGKVEVRPRQPKVDVAADQEALRVLGKTHPGWVREGALAPVKDPIKAGTVAGAELDPQPVTAFDGYRAHEAVVPGDAEQGIDDVVLDGVFRWEPVEKAVTVKPGDAAGGPA